MSADRRTLGEELRALVDGLAVADPVAFSRLRGWVGRRRARIELDGEVVEVAFGTAGLVVGPPTVGQPVDGTGRTTRAVVVDLLLGRAEVTDVILDGRIEMEGTTEALVAILCAIEILVDVASRAPGLRHLADGYLAAEPLPLVGGPVPSARATRWLPDVDPAERELLAELGLPHHVG